ncbi:MAG: 50S ribosomal protein L33 [Elusimicrobiales bacterium]
MATEKYKFLLACETCKNRSYTFRRGKKRETKLELQKFCKTCGKRTKHKETKA